jgi:hypothetical protein
MSLISAANMRHLKKFVCHHISEDEELQETYQEIQENPHLYMNTSFEFIADPNVNFDEINDEF